MKARIAVAAGAVLLAGMAWLVATRSVDELRGPTGDDGRGAAATALQDADFTEQDRHIFRETMARVRAERLDTLSIGPLMAALGRGFVGAPYTPRTLDPEGPERLVVNLREFDCVTFVENMLAMARAVRNGTPRFETYVAELRRIRYRGGRLDGYPSRLHYFSEWIADNGAKGVVEPMTAVLGGEPDAEPLRFMSSHPDAYRQLADPANLAAIRQMEERLSAVSRPVVPETAIAAVADRIREGDIIAATSALPGLDVAHTGIAVRVDGRLHLMHAPLVGRAVEISGRTLAERILRLDSQDGIMVARPR